VHAIVHPPIGVQDAPVVEDGNLGNVGRRIRTRQGHSVGVCGRRDHRKHQRSDKERYRLPTRREYFDLPQLRHHLFGVKLLVRRVPARSSELNITTLNLVQKKPVS